jgi:hypothetical protein
MRLNWPIPIGGLHIFLAFSVRNWEAVLPKALAMFGQVSSYDWRSNGFDDLGADWLRKRDAMNGELMQSFRAANRQRPIDIVVAYVSGYTIAPEVLRDMAAHGAIVTNFCFDDKVLWPGPKKGGRYVSTAALANTIDLNLTSDPDGFSKYFAHGGLSMFHPEAADPEWNRPLNMPFEYDVSFVGARFGWRPKLVEGLRRRGINVVCFGRGWKNGTIKTEAMNEVYAKSRINLGCGGVGFSNKLLCLKGRDFEVPMSGALYLTQHNPELSLVFDLGREILTYRDVDDCARVIGSMLGDPSTAAEIRLAARERCLRDHTYAARWTHVLRILGAIPGGVAGLRAPQA